MSELDRLHVDARELAESIADRLARREPERDLVLDAARLTMVVAQIARLSGSAP